MVMTLMEVEEQALRLPQEQQLQLAHDLLAKQTHDLDASWLDEAELRVSEIDRDAVKLIDATKVFARVRSNLKATR